MGLRRRRQSGLWPAYVPVDVAPPTPQIASISVDGQTVTGSTTANNSSDATALSFDITGVVSGATVSVYIDGDATPIATGTVPAGATSVTLLTNGTNTLANGNHEFVVQQTIATPAVTLLADWTNNSSPGGQFQEPAGTIDSPTSAGTELTIGATPVPPSGYTIAANQAVVNISSASNTGFTFTAAEVGTLYSYTVTSSGGGSVSGSGTVTSATQQVTGVNVSTLADGTLTFSVTLTDTAGNAGTPATATATLDTVAPSGYSIAADPTFLDAASGRIRLHGGRSGQRPIRSASAVTVVDRRSPAAAA